MKSIESPANQKLLTINYSTFEELYFRDLVQKEISKQNIKNKRTAIKIWRESLKLAESSPIGEELNTGFKSSLDVFREYQVKNGIQKVTIQSRVSLIKNFRTFVNFKKQLINESSIDSFVTAINHHLTKAGYNSKEFYEAFLQNIICRATFRHWLSGRSRPNTQKSILIVEKIEKLLNLESGNLASQLKIAKPNKLVKKTKYQIKIQKRQKQIYYVHIPEVQSEYEDLKKFKTTSFLPTGTGRGNNVHSSWTPREDGSIPSAKIAIEYFNRYFCFLHGDPNHLEPLCRGLGIEKELITLGMLTEYEYVERFLNEFMYQRADNIYHSGHLTFLILVTSLLRKKTGYLYQRPEYAQKLGLKITIEEWQKRCLSTRRKLVNFYNALLMMKKKAQPGFGFGRDPHEPIEYILSLRSPINAILEMIEKMKIDISHYDYYPLRQANLYRDMLLTALLIANPLRIRMFQIMNFGENLIQDEDGAWWFFFRRHQFKNRSSLTADYKVRVSPIFWTMITEYQEKYRPILLKDGVSNAVFINGKWKRNRGEARMRALSLAAGFLRRTKSYIENSPGFGPHAMRHIVVTSIVRGQGAYGFFLAAKVLHDKLETVEKNYAHLKTEEFFEPYNDFLSKKSRSTTKDENEGGKQ